jgi:hypothetical protein
MRRCIHDVLNQLTINYEQTQPERQHLAKTLSATDEEFNILEELELLTVDVRGYASQIQVRGWVEDEAAAIAHLQSARLFGNATIAQFYFNTEQAYPGLKDYIRCLDYLRFLVLEYLQVHLHSQSA